MAGSNWTEADVDAYNLRRKIKVAESVPETTDAPDPGPEHVLQRKIEKWLTDRGIAVVHDRSRGKNKPGQPDIIAAMPYGVTLWLELKGSKGRLSEEQKLFRLQLVRLDHLFYEVRSFRRFLEIAKTVMQEQRKDKS